MEYYTPCVLFLLLLLLLLTLESEPHDLGGEPQMQNICSGNATNPNHMVGISSTVFEIKDTKTLLRGLKHNGLKTVWVQKRKTKFTATDIYTQYYTCMPGFYKIH